MDFTVIRNISIITENAEVVRNQDIFIENGRILKIQPADPKEPQGGKIIDGTGLYLSPGIPNLHVHTAMNIFKGIAEDCTADQWFNEKIFPFESKMTKEDVFSWHQSGDRRDGKQWGYGFCGSLFYGGSGT